MAREKKPSELIIYEGKEARRYENGEIRDLNGRLVFLPPELARARGMRNLELAKDAAQDALAEATKSSTPFEGWKKLVAKRVDVALNDDGRAGTEAARFVGTVTGYAPNNNTSVQGVVQHVVTPNFSQRYWEYMKKQEVIDVEAEDAE